MKKNTFTALGLMAGLMAGQSAAYADNQPVLNLTNDSGMVTPGDVITYNISIENTSDQPIYNYNVSSKVDTTVFKAANLELVSNSTGSFTNEQSRYEWNVHEIAPYSTASLVFTLETKAAPKPYIQSYGHTVAFCNEVSRCIGKNKTNQINWDNDQVTLDADLAYQAKNSFELGESIPYEISIANFKDENVAEAELVVTLDNKLDVNTIENIQVTSFYGGLYEGNDYSIEKTNDGFIVNFTEIASHSNFSLISVKYNVNSYENAVKGVVTTEASLCYEGNCITDEQITNLHIYSSDMKMTSDSIAVSRGDKIIFHAEFTNTGTKELVSPGYRAKIAGNIYDLSASRVIGQTSGNAYINPGPQNSQVVMWELENIAPGETNVVTFELEVRSTTMSDTASTEGELKYNRLDFNDWERSYDSIFIPIVDEE